MLVTTSAAAPLPAGVQFGPSSASGDQIIPFALDARASIVVKFKAQAAADARMRAIRATGGAETHDLTQIRTKVLSVPAGAVDRLLAAYNSHPSVERAAPAAMLSAAATPDDPGYSQQWALSQIGWDQAYGAVPVTGFAKIAVLDTGIDASHPDLAGRVGASRSFVGTDATIDPNGHGTAMAGIAAAAVNNAVGLAGVAYAGASLTSVQVLGPGGTGWDTDIVAGVLWAADQGADVILMAFSSPTYSAALADAMAYAAGKGIVLVAATGNDGSSAASYPAGMLNVIGVAATDSHDAVASFSNTGSAAVAAPGVGIYTTAPGGGYSNISGTSAAAAEAAGAEAAGEAALLLASGKSASTTSNQIRGAADPVAGKSFGRINVADALGPLVAPLPTPTVGATPTVAGTPTFEAAACNATLSFSTQPTGAVTSATMSNVVVTQSAVNGACANPSITVAIGTNPSSGTLSGTLTIATASGIATFSTLSINKVGTGYTLVASTSLNANTATSSTFDITKASTTAPVALGSLGTASVVGQAYAVSYSVAVTGPGSGTPTGNVTVSDGTDTCIGTVAAGTCNLTSTTAGAKTISATYAGDSNYNASSASTTQSHTVSKASTTAPVALGSLGTASVVGQAYAASYSVAVTGPGSGTPTGNVTVSDGTDICIGTVAAGTCDLTSTTAGSKTITATYAGDSNYNASSASTTQSHTVSKASTTAPVALGSLGTASVVGQAYAVSYSVAVTGPGSGTPTGNVTVSDGTDTCIGTVAAGTCNLTSTTAGAKTISATYAGDSNYNASSASTTQSHTR